MKAGKAMWAAALLCLASFAAQASNPIDINTAGAEALARVLDGIGPSKAAAIVRYRQQYGPFSTVDELVNVKGVGSKTLAANRDKITLSISQ